MFSRKRMGIAIFATIGLVGGIFAGTSTASAAPTAKPINYIGDHVCPTSMTRLSVSPLEDKAGKAGPAQLNIFWNQDRTKICVTVVHLNEAYGKAAKTSVSVAALGTTKRTSDSGNFKYYAGTVKISVEKCFSLTSSMTWKGTKYFHDDPSICTPPMAPSNTSTPATTANFNKLAACESANVNVKTAPYYGYFKISARQWVGAGGKGVASDQTRATQLKVAKQLQKDGGWYQWPVCAKKLGFMS